MSLFTKEHAEFCCFVEINISSVAYLHEFETKKDGLKSSKFSRCTAVKFPLFRYTKRTFFEEFTESGRLRLGTLYGYRDIEKLGEQIGDETEGGWTMSNVPGNLSPGEIPYVIGGSAVNAWMMCVSARQNKRLYRDFDANCCFQIHDFRFFTEIASALSDAGPIIGSIDAVEYYKDGGALVKKAIERKAVGKDFMVCLQKQIDRYGHQNEVRAVWEPWDEGAQNIRLENQKRLDDELGRLGSSKERMTAEILDGMVNPVNFPDLQARFVVVPDARRFVKLIEYI